MTKGQEKETIHIQTLFWKERKGGDRGEDKGVQDLAILNPADWHRQLLAWLMMAVQAGGQGSCPPYPPG